MRHILGGLIIVLITAKRKDRFIVDVIGAEWHAFTVAEDQANPVILFNLAGRGSISLYTHF